MKRIFVTDCTCWQASDPRWGYGRLHVLLKRELEGIHHKRVYRVYREEGLLMRRRKRKRVAVLPQGAQQQTWTREEAWVMDFMQDVLIDGRRFRILNILDQVTRKCLAIEVDTSDEMRQGQPVDGIGCCFAGPIGNEKDSILGSPNVSDWIRKPFVHDLSKRFACDVLLENDAACAALGEATYGQGKDKDFLFLIWGTGFGGTAVTQTRDGIQVRPMEAGHTILDWNSDRICGCGQAGCAEAYLGGVNIHKYSGKSAEDLTEDEWQAVYGQMAHAMINVLATNYKPLIIFGGGIACNQKDRFAQIECMLHQRFKIYPMPALLITEHADNVGLLGCLALFARSANTTAATTKSTKAPKKTLLPSWLRKHPTPTA